MDSATFKNHNIIDMTLLIFNFIDKLQELNKCKIELQYWRSKSTTLLALPSTINPTCASCSVPLLPEGGLQSAENAEAELKNLANKGNLTMFFLSNHKSKGIQKVIKMDQSLL